MRASRVRNARQRRGIRGARCRHGGDFSGRPVARILTPCRTRASGFTLECAPRRLGDKSRCASRYHVIASSQLRAYVRCFYQ